ncbi:Rid family hydrolase [Thioalkalivibrio sp. HK1]|uniref:Rid family hydrolase n=1 Tax=Thioalkalivibrio sp. HK1 TaxID=1469245 RepID=UPI0004721075|nr:Rid family hydrolase [Thioalkalivibrio sp. HK1]
MMVASEKSGGRFEEIGAYSRVKRIGPHVWVAGTAAIEPSGRIHAPGDCYAQTRYILRRIEQALSQVGAELSHVARVRCYLADMSHASEFIRAHGEVFRGIDPVLTAVVAGLSQPELVVEIDVDALIHEPSIVR